MKMALYFGMLLLYVTVNNLDFVLSDCLGEFQQVPTGECTMSLKDGNNTYCKHPAEGKYVCPISKVCVDSAEQYLSCPGINGTYLDWRLSIDDRLNWLIQNLTMNRIYLQLTNGNDEITELGIPAYQWLNDDIHSVRVHHATVFPDGCGLGATWSKKDLYDTAHIIAIEARSIHNSLVHNGIRGGAQYSNGAGITTYGPNMNLVRDPRWGRSQEVYSEDPRLTGHLTHHFVRGYQFGGQQDDKYMLVSACCKHYAAYDLENEPESRFTYNAVVDAVNWAETYSPMFRECVVRSNVLSIMCSYNSINGVPTCGSKDILTTVLREQWGYKGFVVSDYDAMQNIYKTHNYTNNMTDAVALALSSGCDQEGGGNAAIDQVPNALKEGILSDEDVITAFKRLWRTRFLLGMFDPPTMVKYFQLNNDSTVEGPEHLNISRTVAAHSMCLYKNNLSILPLDPQHINKLAVIGPQSISTNLLLGNYDLYPDKGVPSMIQAIRDALGEPIHANCVFLENTDNAVAEISNPVSTYSVEECCNLCFNIDTCNFFSFHQDGSSCHLKGSNGSIITSPNITSGYCTNNKHVNDTKVYYAEGCNGVSCGDTSKFNEALDLLKTLGNELSAVIVYLGLDQSIESEGHDRTTIELPGYQNELVTQISNITRLYLNPSVPLICVLIHGGTLALGDAMEQCDGIIDAWYPGQMGSYGFSDILFGRINPAGRASVTYYKSTNDLPKPGDMNLYHGNGTTYRYFKGEPLIPFGFGLSYTTFKYVGLKLNATEVNGCDVIGIIVSVENTGIIDGDEVVQLYVTQPNGTVPVPQVRLADFERVTIKPAQIVEVELVLTPRYHSVVYSESSPTYYEPDINIEKGEFMVFVGGGQPKYYKESLNATVNVISSQKLITCINQD